MNNGNPEPPRRGPRWWQGALFFLLALGVQGLMVLALIAIQLSGALGSTPEEVTASLFSPGSLALQVVGTCSALTILAFLGSRLGRGEAVESLNLRRAPRGATAIAILGIIPVGIAIDEITFGLHYLAPGVFDTAGLETFVQIFSASSTSGFIVATIAVTVGPAFGEELFFCGLVLRAFRRDFPLWLAVFLSSLLFGALHLDALQGAGATLIGAYLGLVVVTTRSIWPAVAGHALNNLLCSLFARTDPQGAGQAFAHGHPLWLVTAAVLLAVLAILALVRLRVSRRRTSVPWSSRSRPSLRDHRASDR